MNNTRLGGTDTFVSEMCLGTMYFGSRVSEDRSHEIMDRYVESGGSFLDTANNYCYWLGDFTGDESETILGHWMKDRGNRNGLFLATKCGVRPVPGKEGEFEGLSRQAIRSAIDGSLSRLGTDWIDLYYMHVDWRKEPLEETLGALAELVDEGRVRHIGCSNMSAWRLAQAQSICRTNGWPVFSAIQQWYSYLRPRYHADMWVQRFVDDELLDYAVTEGDVTILAYTSTLGGLYKWNSLYERKHPAITDRFHSEDNERRFAAIKSISEERGVSPFQVVFAWIHKQEARIVPVLGVSSVRQLEDNLKSMEWQLSDEEFDRLEDAAFNRHPYETEEEYSLL